MARFLFDIVNAMNERIKELFKRAGGKTTVHNLASNPVQYREYNELWDDRIEKFAELIVRECAKVCIEKYYYSDRMSKECGINFAKDIKRHFGVKE